MSECPGTAHTNQPLSGRTSTSCATVRPWSTSAALTTMQRNYRSPSSAAPYRGSRGDPAPLSHTTIVQPSCTDAAASRAQPTGHTHVSGTPSTELPRRQAPRPVSQRGYVSHASFMGWGWGNTFFIH